MAIDIKLNVKIDQYNGAMAQMARKLESSGITMRQIIDFEVGRILETTLQRTDTATNASIQRSQDRRGEWRTYDLGKGQKKYLLTNRYPDPLWKQIEDRLAASLAKKIAAKGFAKQSWLALAAAIGFQIRAPGYVVNSKKDGVSNTQNVRIARMGGGTKYTLAIENSSPLMRWSGGQQAFFSAIAGRVRYIQKNLALGVFKDLQQVAKRFPGLVVTV